MRLAVFLGGFAVACSTSSPKSASSKLGEPTRIGTHEEGRVELVGFTPDGVVTHAGSSARRWDLATHTSTPIGQDTSPLAISPAGVLASGSANEAAPGGSVQIGREVPIMIAQDLAHVAFSGDGRRLAVAERDGSVAVIDVVRNTVASTWAAYDATETRRGGTDFGDGIIVKSVVITGPEPIEAIAMSRDATRVITAGGEGMIRVWDAATGARQLELWHQFHDTSFVALAGNLAITATESDGLQLWKGSEVATTLYAGDDNRREGTTDAVSTAALSSDGAWLATGHRSGMVRLWDLRARKEIASAKRHCAAVTAAAISSDGTQLATAADDGLLLWPLR